ncbi:thiamine-phosphate synthase family protein [Vulcanisaeta distributa]|uniref:Phosphomethylpyrimidine kinase n=1 Tax=Vulcanisaeta distributa (strain DSM 14429 / JCM 11212 / NBRC 100878 / IC-017) TaxID=572478 RepID=E1QR38_VULDI|nr:thiamine-phosphate synthase family protein [Vulcanisaeta distributa]ADN51728.1 Phosphomethylpyrimidine kinase [Vulcanisaeta distributa DSM 14429]
MSISTGLEFAAENVLPIIRSLIAKRLLESGYSQLRVAKILGVTQPAVNRYVSRDYDELLSKAESLGINRDWVLEVVKNVVELVLSSREYEALEYLTNAVIMELGSLRLCDAHRRLVPSLPTNCNVCSVLITGISDSIIKNVERALSILEAHPEIQVVIPRVLMNIVEAKPGAVTEDDVVGVPGRIDAHDGRVIVGSRPTYGGSKHLGRLIIKCMNVNPRYRSVASIKYDEKVENALRGLGIHYVKVGPHESPNEDEVISAVANSLIKDPTLEVVIDLGGYALEPVTYVFGLDAMDVALKIVRIASRIT